MGLAEPMFLKRAQALCRDVQVWRAELDPSLAWTGLKLPYLKKKKLNKIKQKIKSKNLFHNQIYGK